MTNRLGNYHVQSHEEKTLEMDNFTKENVEWYKKFLLTKDICNSTPIIKVFMQKWFLKENP
jgi:hypothetical protein